MSYDPTNAVRDPARLAAVRATDLPEPGATEAFDRLARLAAGVLRAPVAFVSLVAEDREILKGAVGLPAPLPLEREIPLSHSFARHVVARGEPLVVDDARAHPLLCENPATRMGMIAYLGVPLATAASHVLGALCVVHTEPRAWLPGEIRILEHLAATAVAEIELRAALHAAEKLRRQNESILNSAGDGIYGLDTQGRAIFANPAAAKMLGREVEELLGQRIDVLVQHSRPDGTPYPPGESPIQLTLKYGETQQVEGDIFWRKDGTSFPVQYISAPIWEDGQLVGAVVTFQDISARRTLEEQFRQAQKMEAVGRLAGGVAHDFNNLLTAILGYCDLLLDERSRLEARKSEIEEIRKAASRAAALTRQLLAFSRRQVLQPRVLDLNAVVANMENMLRRLIGEDIEFTTVLDPELGRVKADPGQLEQVVMNLVVNARDAMPNGGRLTIETRNADLGETFARKYYYVQPGPYVMLAVSDTGHGMDKETQARIFEPFFTTKEKGTGLGLATVYGIVKQSGGYIWVYSEPGQGTTFRVYLPLVQGVAEKPEAPPPPSVAPHGSEVVLLVEDEETVRTLVRKVLEHKGYTVLEARNGPEAIRISESYAGPIDLVITDMIMPQMGGRELAARLCRSRPAMKVLFISGYTGYEIVERGLLEPGTPLLEKPFTPQTLARRIREVLEGPPPS